MSLFNATLKQYNINIINNYDNINYSENDICVAYDKIFDHNEYVKNRKHPNVFMSKINKCIDGIDYKLYKNRNYIELDECIIIIHNKVLLIYDVDGWAWHHKAKAIQKYNTKYNIHITNCKKLSKINYDNYDSIHIFGWQFNIPQKKIITCGVSSYNYEMKHKDTFYEKIKKYNGVSCVAPYIYDDLKNKINLELHKCYNGVDLEIFKPLGLPFNTNNYITLGWIGQEKSKTDIHGNRIIELLEEKLKDTDIKCIFNNKNASNAIPHNEMYKFYEQIDIMIHSGIGTGTPNPLFEAAASGRVLISTDIGCSKLLIKNDYNGFLTKSCRIDNNMCNEEDAKEIANIMYKKVIYLDNNKHMINIMGKRNLKVIKNWSWEKKAYDWIPLFKYYKN